MTWFWKTAIFWHFDKCPLTLNFNSARGEKYKQYRSGSILQLYSTRILKNNRNPNLKKKKQSQTLILRKNNLAARAYLINVKLYVCTPRTCISRLCKIYSRSPWQQIFNFVLVDEPRKQVYPVCFFRFRHSITYVHDTEIPRLKQEWRCFPPPTSFVSATFLYFFWRPATESFKTSFSTNSFSNSSAVSCERKTALQWNTFP